MSEEETMNVLNWIPPAKSNNMSIESANRIKPRLLPALKSIYIYQQKKIFLTEPYYILEY